MASVVDASIWVDCLRKESPETLRRRMSAIIMADDSFLCEPVIFELLRAIPKRDLTRTETLMATLPVLPTPSDLWDTSRALGRKCADNGLLPPAMDLLIAGVCLYHEVTIVTFDNHFQQISEVSPLKIALLNQEGPA